MPNTFREIIIITSHLFRFYKGNKFILKFFKEYIK
jgi:hypothetical protein